MIHRLSARALLTRALCVVAVASGCSLATRPERMFRDAQAAHAATLRDAAHARPEQAAAAIAEFDRVARLAPGTIWSARAHAVIGSLHALRQERAAAREAYYRILAESPQQQGLCGLARLAIAQTDALDRRARSGSFQLETLQIAVAPTAQSASAPAR